MVDVEKHALRALEQDPLAAPQCLVKVAPDGPSERKHERGNFAEIGEQPLAVDRRFAEAGAKRVVVSAEPVEIGAEFVEMRKIADPDRAAADLVIVRRADAAPGRADLAGARRILAQAVEVAVDGKDQGTG